MEAVSLSMQVSCSPRWTAGNRPARIASRATTARAQLRAPSCTFLTARRSVRSARGASVQVRAEASPAGQITNNLVKAMTDKIGRALDTDNVKIVDLNGDGRHVNIDVISAAFDGKSAVERQRMVYKAIWSELQEAVHAVDAMTTKTPSEAGL